MANFKCFSLELNAVIAYLAWQVFRSIGVLTGTDHTVPISEGKI